MVSSGGEGSPKQRSNDDEQGEEEDKEDKEDEEEEEDEGNRGPIWRTKTTDKLKAKSRNTDSHRSFGLGCNQHERCNAIIHN